MNYFRLAIAILFAAFAQCSRADTIQTFDATQVSIVMGSDGSVSWSITGPGLEITGDGGALCLGCPNGSPSGGIFIGFIFTAILGGKSYDPFTELGFNTSPFNDGLGLNPIATGSFGAGTPFKLILPQNGSWQFDFVPDPNNPGSLLFNGGTFLATATVTPEPATVSLMLTGLVGIAGIIKKKARRQRSEAQTRLRTISRVASARL